MNITRNNLKLLIKQVLNESRGMQHIDEDEREAKDLTWKKIVDNLSDEGFRLIVLKSLSNANKQDAEFMSDMFETLTKEEDKEIQQIIINNVERIYKEGEL
jgi:hypothetical protein